MKKNVLMLMFVFAILFHESHNNFANFMPFFSCLFHISVCVCV